MIVLVQPMPFIRASLAVKGTNGLFFINRPVLVIVLDHVDSQTARVYSCEHGIFHCKLHFLKVF